MLAAVGRFSHFTYRLISAMTRSKPYQGSQRKLVLAFDVGTTYSRISYCILYPGEFALINPVTKYIF